MICCGSGSDFGKVLVPVPDPDPDIITVSQKQNNCAKSCLFNVRNSFPPEILPLIFVFSLFYYILCWIRIQIQFRHRIRNRTAFRFQFLRFRLYNTVKNVVYKEFYKLNYIQEGNFVKKIQMGWTDIKKFFYSDWQSNPDKGVTITRLLYRDLVKLNNQVGKNNL